ncbi:MAG: PBP1A family penicillin-binding protein [Gammaproteobacteria bacterium]|jgi:penicillin-binding protein 1A|nr:PBP1A family penicillin-binding protein [Gammaproteobacteria bacterium]MBT4607282.1 PBP1A family penicillin-binding protein [Thiotrichales bacterium]MBT3473873.1 PBP1A family penicillin-binding protein [Gammaproteobacteria bacterium]MBT3892557.1 PBP1A family penicillin-binding protein [Gammaproteobacteria bacterium]MBT3966177.1 PBP1A family penicillin-binding protein [Gammaproteobacteria bacterium]
MRLLLLLLSTLPLIAGGILWHYIDNRILPALPSQQEIEDIQMQTPLRVLARDGSLIAEFGEKHRTPLTFSEIPQPMIDAIIAAEDERFFEHPGIDATGIARAAFQYLITGQKRQGGSTITMQMARNFFLTREKSWERKIKELFLAVRIEESYSKQDILTLYLNKVFLGHRAYGIEAAFQTYYGVSSSQATLAQTAMIAALPKAPSSINPIRNPKRAKERRNYVLDRMKLLGKISEQAHRKAIKRPLSAKLHRIPVQTAAPYAAEMVRAELVRILGKSVYGSGIRVTTTIQPHLQKGAIHSLRKTVTEVNQRQRKRQKDHPEEFTESKPPKQGVQGALVALNPNNGAVVALSGGTDFNKTPFNRVTQSMRQMGSTIKPLIYSTALHQGKTAATLLNDAPLVFKGSLDFPPWKPENSGHRFHGPTLLEDGLIYSRNLASIRLLQQVGFKPVLRHLNKLGLPKSRIKQHQDLTLAVGSLPASPLEVASAYIPFANGGKRIKPYLIEKIEGGSLSNCTLCKKGKKSRVLNRQVHYLIDQMLKKVIQRGTAQAAKKLKRTDIGGKTGTSNRAVDTWFAGYHPDLVAVSWIGYDQPYPLGKGESGGHTALPMWIRFMEGALKTVAVKRPTRPAGMATRYIDPATGKGASAQQKNKRLLTFRKGFQPHSGIESVTGKSVDELRDEALQLW